MKALFNQELINDNELVLGKGDRAVEYGDGLFETIIIKNNSRPLLNYHYQRLVDGAKILDFLLPENFSPEYLNISIEHLIQINHLSLPVKIKVQVWRESGGTYSPLMKSSNMLITMHQYKNPPDKIENVGICQSIQNQFSVYSQFKTISAIKYVLAGIEKESRNLDDLIILDAEGNVSELLDSNIFWIKDGIFFTPSLESGCVRGVMRSYLIDILKHQNNHVEETIVSPGQLQTADHILSTNASGIRPITSIQQKKYKVFPDMDELVP